MKTLQASNLTQAVKALKKIDETLVSKIEKNVKDADKRHYHVILVRVKDRPGQTKNDVSVTTQTYSKLGFEKIKKNFVFQGFANAILLHDPSTLSAEELAKPKKGEKVAVAPVVPPVDTKKDETISSQAQEIADLKAKLAAKPKKEVAPVVPPVDNGSVSPPPEPTVKGDVDFDVSVADFKGLNEFAADNKIELGTAKSTDAIRIVVKDWIAKQATK